MSGLLSRTSAPTVEPGLRLIRKADGAQFTVLRVGSSRSPRRVQVRRSRRRHRTTHWLWIDSLMDRYEPVATERSEEGNTDG